MRFGLKNAAVAAVAAIAVFGFGASAHAQSKCNAAKAKCVAKLQAGILGCYAKAAGKAPGTVDPACISKATGKFSDGVKGCIDKLDAKNDGCGATVGDASHLAAIADANIDRILGALGLDNPPPSTIPAPLVGKCLAGQIKCAIKPISGELGCYSKAIGAGSSVDSTCIAKSQDKFDGGADPTKGCIAKLEAKGGCQVVGATDDVLDIGEFLVGQVNSHLTVTPTACTPGPTCPNSGNGLEVCNAEGRCDCAGIIRFTGIANNPSLDTGWTGIAHDNTTISDGAISVAVTSCAGDGKPCGNCTFAGPVANPGADAGVMNNQRCSHDTSIKCTSDATCGGGNTCEFYFGSLLPLSSGGVSTCVVNQIVGSVVGTYNAEAGTSASSVLLLSKVFNGITTPQPCPQCVGDGANNDGVAGGTCNGGARNGLACDGNGTSPVPSFGTTSLDCPPVSGAQIAGLNIPLDNSTGTETFTVSDTTSPSCTAAGFGAQRCACDTCQGAGNVACTADSDCPGTAAGRCGGLRCLPGSGGATGAACTTAGAGDPTCMGGLCGRPGQPTAPNACADSVCTPSVGNEGECLAGPFDQRCTIERFRSCSVDGDCTALGDTCNTEVRECYTEPTITATGDADPPVNDNASPTLASLFCVAPTSSSAVNGVAGLPGLARLELAGDANGLP